MTRKAARHMVPIVAIIIIAALTAGAAFAQQRMRQGNVQRGPKACAAGYQHKNGSTAAPRMAANSAAPTNERPARRAMGRQCRHKVAANRRMMMSEELGLTSDQVEKIKSVRQDTQKAVRSVKADNTLTEQEKLEKIRSIREQSHEKCRSVLTPPQLEKMKNCCAGRWARQ